jgi:hypothetical protein
VTRTRRSHRAVGLALAPVLALVGGGCARDLPSAAVTCTDLGGLALVAQAVPEAQAIPCFPATPFGYRTTTFDVGSGHAEIGLSHAVLGADVAVLRIAARCDVDEGPVPATPALGARSDHVVQAPGGGVTGHLAEGLGGACLVVALRLDHPDGDRALADLDGAWTLLPRADLAADLARESGGRLRLDEHSAG